MNEEEQRNGRRVVSIHMILNLLFATMSLCLGPHVLEVCSSCLSNLSLKSCSLLLRLSGKGI